MIMSPSPFSAALYYIRPRLDEATARTRLPFRPLRLLFRKIPLSRVELVYLPHYQWKLVVGGRSKEEAVSALVDAVAGHLAFFQEEGLEISAAEEREFEIPFLLSPAEAEQSLHEQYRWTLIAGALKSGERYELKSVSLERRIYYPFWAGYYQVAGKFRFELLDGVTGMRQGGKVREAFLSAWVRQKRETEKKV